VARSTPVFFSDRVIALHVGSTAIVISCLRRTVPRKVMLPAASKNQRLETTIYHERNRAPFLHVSHDNATGRGRNWTMSENT